jgi:hypothetical protein
MFSSAWNDFQGSGVIGDRFWLDYGNHMLTLRVTQADNIERANEISVNIKGYDVTYIACVI